MYTILTCIVRVTYYICITISIYNILLYYVYTMFYFKNTTSHEKRICPRQMSPWKKTRLSMKRHICLWKHVLFYEKPRLPMSKTRFSMNKCGPISNTLFVPRYLPTYLSPYIIYKPWHLKISTPLKSSSIASSTKLYLGSRDAHCGNPHCTRVDWAGLRRYRHTIQHTLLIINVLVWFNFLVHVRLFF